MIDETNDSEAEAPEDPVDETGYDPKQEEFLQRVEESVGKIFEELVKNVDLQMTQIEERMDAQDELIANLFKAYTQINSALESTIAEVMSPRSEEEREQFRKDLNRRHTDTLKMMQEVGREVERSNPQDPTASILSMVGEEQGDLPVWERSQPVDSSREDPPDDQDA